MVAKELVVAVFLLGVSCSLRDGTLHRDDGPLTLPVFRTGPNVSMQEQCISNGGEEAKNNAERAVNEWNASRHINLVDQQGLNQDIAEAQRLSKSIHEVIRKHVCPKKGQLLGHISAVTESFKPCFKAGERARGNLDVVRNAMGQVLEHICQQDGVMTLFTAGDEKCLQQQGPELALQGCVLSYLLSILPQRGEVNIITLLDVDFDDSTCRYLYKFQKCVVQSINICSEELGHAAQELIRSVRLTTPCKDKPNSASGLIVTALSSVMAASCLLLV